jgi:DNA mismatch endonuclease (patch repair protein)
MAIVCFFREHYIVGWRRHLPILGKPDFAFPTLKVAVFVDGCFWHACPTHFRMPLNNRAFWEKKLAVNRRRDRAVTLGLRRAGWRVIRIWEHDLKRSNRVPSSIRRLVAVVGGRAR